MAKQNENKPKRSRTGAPVKLTKELQDEICEWLSEGGFVENACHMVGISKVSYYSWRKQGREQKTGKYRDFLNATNKAQATAQTKLVSLIEQAAFRDWKAAAWVLVRMNPKVFAQSDRVELTGKNRGPIECSHKRTANELSDDELAAIITRSTG